MFPLSIDNYFELAAFIISALIYPKLKGTAFRLFPLFLFFIVMVELAGRYISNVLRHHNSWLFNISTTVEFVFYAYIFSLHLQNPAYKKLAQGFMIIYPPLALLNIFFIQGFFNWHSYTIALGSVFMVIFCSLFFYELLLNPVEEELGKDPMFWIATGVFFFYLGDLSYNLFFNLLTTHASDTAKKLFQSINNNLTLILYSCFIMAFLCKRNHRRSLSQ